MGQFRRILRHLGIDRVHDDTDEQVQGHEGRQQDEDQEEGNGIRMALRQRLHDAPRPVVEGHDLKERIGRGPERAELLRIGLAEELRRHHGKDVEDERQQEHDRAHARQRGDEPADHPLERGHGRDQAQHPQHAQRPEHRQRTCGRNEGDPDHREVEHAPGIAEEREAVHHETGGQL